MLVDLDGDIQIAGRAAAHGMTAPRHDEPRPRFDARRHVHGNRFTVWDDAGAAARAARVSRQIPAPLAAVARLGKDHVAARGWMRALTVTLRADRGRPLGPPFTFTRGAPILVGHRQPAIAAAHADG